MTSLAESTLRKYSVDPDNWERMDAANAELDRRFWAERSPKEKEQILAMQERAYECQQRSNLFVDDDRLYSHDPREQE